MRIVFFSNYLNHHQIPVAEEFNKLNTVEYTFVATTGVPEFRKKLGYEVYKKDFLLDVTLSEQNKLLAKKMAVEADVAIFLSNGMNEYIIPRLKTGKITFEYSERWFKKKYFLNILSPNLWKHQYMYYRYGRNANLYMLCSSAFAPNDYYLLNSYKDRCYKWGYFPQPSVVDIDQLLETKSAEPLQIMWCGRFIDWKHPELVVYLANKLKQDNRDFSINMYGNGPKLDYIKSLVDTLQLNQYVHLPGNASNADIIKAMQSHHIYLFTSDKNEGWGAVANEAMSNGCAIVASDKIGSIPYLVKDGENGLVFESENLSSLYVKVNQLLDDRHKIEELAKTAYNDMKSVWSPANAVNSFMKLCSSLEENSQCPIPEGPCSKAVPVRRN